MAQWQVTKKGEPIRADLYDDRGTLAPGDEGFSAAGAVAFAKANGGDSVNYVGPSADHDALIAAEDAEALAEG